MKSSALLLAILLGSLALPSLASDTPAEASISGKSRVSTVGKIEAVVSDIDQDARLVRLVGSSGSATTLLVGPEVRNFANVRVGDYLTVRYRETVELELLKEKLNVRMRLESAEGARATPGGKPGGWVRHKLVLMADVASVDMASGQITLKGPERTTTYEVEDKPLLGLVKPGDQVKATISESTALSMEPASQ